MVTIAGDGGTFKLAFFTFSATSSSPCVRALGLDRPPVGFSPAIS